MANLTLIVVFMAIICGYKVAGTSSRQYNSAFKRSTRGRLMSHVTTSKSAIGEGESQSHQIPKKRGRKRTTTVTINSCNAEFCDPGWEPYPNIVSTVTGYNILKGNAYNLGTEQDPGFETGYIFVPVVKDDDDRYALHGGITIRAISKCDLSMKTKTVSTVKGYQNINREAKGIQKGLKTNPPVEISAKGVTVELPPLFEAFGAANEAFRQHEEFFTKRRGVVTVNDATCALYAMQISRRYPPPFQQAFKNAVKALSEASVDQRKAAFHDFIQEFGTHYVQKSTIGARLSIVRRYSRDTFQTATEEEIENCNKQRLGYFYVKEESGNKCTSLQNAAESMIFKNIQREQIISYGSKPSASVIDWANQEFQSPVPIKMTLAPIIDLFHKDFMDSDEDLKLIDCAKMKAWMTPFYSSYCEDMKSDLGIELCNPGDVERCGYNDNCNPAYQDCVQTGHNSYKCDAKVTKAYVTMKVKEAMGKIVDGLKADDVAKLIDREVFSRLHGFEGYIFAKGATCGNMQVAGENAGMVKGNSFHVAFAWAGVDNAGNDPDFAEHVRGAFTGGRLCSPFNDDKISSMNSIIRLINEEGHHVNFFIHANDQDCNEDGKIGASETRPDYHERYTCDRMLQCVFIGPGHG